MKLYGGIDLHSNNSVIALLDEEDRPVYRQRLANDASVILEALVPYREDIVGLVVESTYNWYWLEQKGSGLAIQHRPTKIRPWPDPFGEEKGGQVLQSGICSISRPDPFPR